uniref:Uncharacterized protein n=1 Tax=Amphiprion ocellaris TaxID=80972 RepID=A0A3Q1CEU4_AMPOC
MYSWGLGKCSRLDELLPLLESFRDPKKAFVCLSPGPKSPSMLSNRQINCENHTGHFFTLISSLQYELSPLFPKTCSSHVLPAFV